jgi:hypothetical protein
MAHWQLDVSQKVYLMIFLRGWVRRVNLLRKTTNCVGDDSIFYFDREEEREACFVLHGTR